jgi:hypothetical protein
LGILKKNIAARLKGFVLLESIFAMVIIMVCFGICLVIFSQIASSPANSLQVKARIRLQAEAEHCKTNRQFIDGTVSFEEFVIEKTFLKKKESALTEMKLVAVNPQGRVIGEYHEFIIP